MFKRILSRIARCIPLYREVLQIRDSLNAINESLRIIQYKQSVHYVDAALENNPHYQDLRRLQRYAFQVNSQNYEDGSIGEIFRRIGTSNCVFAEIGVGDGKENNTAFLLSKGWKGFWIDGSDLFLKTLHTRQDLKNGCIKPFVAFVTKENIAQIFADLAVPENFDLLSIDIDHNTFYIWEALHNFKPRVVVVEYNAAIPPDIEWKVQYVADRSWDYTQNFGASLKAFEKLGTQLGYSLVGCDFMGINAFFVRNDLVGNNFAEPFTAENHYEPVRYSYIHRRGHQRSILDRDVVLDKRTL